MEQDELNRMIVDRLKEKGLGNYLVKDKSQLLEFPEEYFAEIVLDDAGKIDDASAVLEEVAAQLDRKNQKLDYIVRAVWQVENVESQLPVEELQQRMRKDFFSLPFVVTLKSGSRKQRVGVEVWPGAYGRLEFAEKQDGAALREFVKRELEGWLSVGGAGYWDPIREPRRIVAGAWASYELTGH